VNTAQLVWIVFGGVVVVGLICDTVDKAFKAKYGAKDTKQDKTIDYDLGDQGGPPR
jgi:hypothetical protein